MKVLKHDVTRIYCEECYSFTKYHKWSYSCFYFIACKLLKPVYNQYLFLRVCTISQLGSQARHPNPSLTVSNGWLYKPYVLGIRCSAISIVIYSDIKRRKKGQWLLARKGPRSEAMRRGGEGHLFLFFCLHKKCILCIAASATRFGVMRGAVNEFRAISTELCHDPLAPSF